MESSNATAGFASIPIMNPSPVNKRSKRVMQGNRWASLVTLGIILRDYLGAILRVRVKGWKWPNWLPSPRRLVNVRFSALNFCALTLMAADRLQRSLVKPSSLTERCSIG
jgi:hypothetical protein